MILIVIDEKDYGHGVTIALFGGTAACIAFAGESVSVARNIQRNDIRSASIRCRTNVVALTR
jgi:hypothetical protein